MKKAYSDDLYTIIASVNSVLIMKIINKALSRNINKTMKSKIKFYNINYNYVVKNNLF